MSYKTVLFFLAAMAAAQGQAAETGMERISIGSITVVAPSGAAVEGSFVRAHVASKEGAALDPSVIALDVRSLLESGRFSYVGTRVAETNGVAALAFVVEFRRRLANEPVLVGVRKLGRKTVLEAFGVNAGDFVDEQILAAAGNRLKAKYREKRFYDAVVTTEAIGGEAGGVELIVTVEEGARESIGLIDFNGNESISKRDLRRFSQQTPWWNPAGWFAIARLSEFDLELMRSDICRQYFDKGMLDVEVEGPIIARGGGRMDISFDINEGPVYRVGTVGLNGVTLFPESAVLAAARLRRGDVAGLAAVEAARAAVEAYFTSKGYVDTRVTTLTYPGEGSGASGAEGVLDIVFSVKEGPLVHVGKVLIRGNTSTKDKVIRREISLNPGDVYDGVAADLSRRRLQNLGYFSNVGNYGVASADAPGTRDLVYDLDESRTGSLMLGAGFSSVDHLIGMFEISQSNFDIANFKNFRGAGQKARMSLQVSSDSTDLEANWTEPWFLDRRLALDVNAFVRNRSYNEYDERRGGASVGVSKHVPWVGRVGLTYTLQNVRLTDVMTNMLYLVGSPEDAYRFSDEDDSYLLGSLRLSWTYDTRDRPMIPTSGTRATFNGTLYNSAFGSDYEFYELDLRVKQYFPLWYGHVLSISGRASTIDSYGSDEVPISSRYFLGGGRNTRGFRYRDIGPKATPTPATPAAGSAKFLDPAASRANRAFHPVGGQTQFEVSAEYSIPIVSFLRIAAFCDLGNVWADAYDFDLSNYASSAGGGIRLDIPGFPVRFDYAEALSSDDDYTRERRFVFWVGFD